MIPVFHNVVATIQIECEPIDIAHLSQLLPYTSYDKKKFAAITIRLHSPPCTCLLFTSGKLVVTGAKSWDEALLTAYCIKDILSDAYPYGRFEIRDFQIQNMVAHVELPFDSTQTLNLNEFYSDHSSEITYQPRMFPGLIFRPLHSSLVFLCFSSGKIVITGGMSEDEIQSAWRATEPLVRRYIISTAADASRSHAETPCSSTRGP